MRTDNTLRASVNLLADTDSDDDSDGAVNLRNVSEQVSVSTTANRKRRWCSCFVKIADKGGDTWCKRLNKRWNMVTRDKYCRYCRNSLLVANPKGGGNIVDYFELFKFWQLLDEDDKTFLRARS